MISFLLSLFIVDRQQRAWRVAQHEHHMDPWWKRLSPWIWYHAEPYQSHHDSTWQHAVPATSPSGEAYGSVPAPASAVEAESWYTHKKHRKMAKLELSDAWDMERSMAFVLVTAGLLGLVTVAFLVKFLYIHLLNKLT